MSDSQFPTRDPGAVHCPSDQPTLHTQHGEGTPAPGVPETRAVEGAATQGKQDSFVGGYEILEELGRGGMGVVYKARQKGLGRIVALKMILHGDHAGVENRLRFLREAEALAQLRHENIVQVYEVGEFEDKPFISLEFVEGGNLDKRLCEGPLPASEAARLVEQLARAMQAAHEVGIIHRDLKPANVLLQKEVSRKDAKAQREDAESDLGGLAPVREIVPKITDFGLAKRQDAGGLGGLSASGAILGTPSYMAPEQAAGKGREVDARADVYALGAILYECLTGRPPFRAAAAMDTLLQVLHDEPPPMRSLRPAIPVDLETVCLKCLQKEPRRRYGSARELAEDLGSYGRGEPVRARPVGRLERSWRWCKRNPVIAGLLTAVVMLAGAVSGLVLMGVWRDQGGQANNSPTSNESPPIVAPPKEFSFTTYLSFADPNWPVNFSGSDMDERRELRRWLKTNEDAAQVGQSEDNLQSRWLLSDPFEAPHGVFPLHVYIGTEADVRISAFLLRVEETLEIVPLERQPAEGAKGEFVFRTTENQRGDRILVFLAMSSAQLLKAIEQGPRFWMGSQPYSENITISGVIVDAEKRPLPNVKILLILRNTITQRSEFPVEYRGDSSGRYAVAVRRSSRIEQLVFDPQAGNWNPRVLTNLSSVRDQTIDVQFGR